MIADVDQALRAIIEEDALQGASVEVTFDAPTKEWAGKRTGPTVDVFLYDIREDPRRRQNGMVNEYSGDHITARHLPPRSFRLSYLVAAWTQRAEDEHALLARLLTCFLQYPVIPSQHVGGTLADTGLPVLMSVALPPSEDRSFADVWSALGGELKPSLDVVVTAPLAVPSPFSVGPPVRQPAVVVAEGLGGTPARETHRRRREHR